MMRDFRKMRDPDIHPHLKTDDGTVVVNFLAEARLYPCDRDKGQGMLQTEPT